MLIGKTIKGLRKKRKMTLTELSRKSGIQLATLSRIENSKMMGTVESHINIAKALGVEITDLYKGISAQTKNLTAETSQPNAEAFKHNEKSSHELLTKNIAGKKMVPVLI